MIFINYSLLRKIYKKKNAFIKSYNRSSVISKALIGYIIAVHNGKKFINVNINDKMLNRKLGEFSLTRKFPKHISLDKKLKQKKTKKK